MKRLTAILIVVLPVVAIAQVLNPITLTTTAQNTSLSEGVIHVTVTNTQKPETITIRSKATCTIDGLQFTCFAEDYLLTISHNPITINSLSVEVSAPWLLLDTPQPFTLNDGQTMKFDLRMVKVEVIR